MRGSVAGLWRWSTRSTLGALAVLAAVAWVPLQAAVAAPGQAGTLPRGVSKIYVEYADDRWTMPAGILRDEGSDEPLGTVIVGTALWAPESETPT